MVAGVGIDMIEIERIAEKLGRNRGFREHVFSKAEIEYCEKMADPIQHFAARFAAKEALVKATGLGFAGCPEPHTMEIVHDAAGAPAFHFLGDAIPFFKEMNLTRIHVSLSHIRSAACAVVVLEK